MTLTKIDLVEKLIKELEITRKDAINYVELVFETIKQTLERGENVKISGFGIWRTKDKRSRMGRNPQTGQPMEISARKVITFKPSQLLRQALNEQPK